jgi:hypothetical protein
MSLELLQPIESESFERGSILPKQILGKNILIHTKNSGIPELKGIRIAIIGLSEARNSFFINDNS